MTDIYYKKTVDLSVGKHTLHFDVAQALFSSHEVDAGSKMLLKSLPDGNWGKVLDVGCGYGTLGLALKAADTRRDVHLVDRDALAVAFTERNAAKNKLDVTAVASLGFDDVPATDYDLIVSNIPGKAGEAVISDWLMQARHFLAPQGLVAVVIVAPLVALIDAVLAGLPDVAVSHRETNRSYGVFHFRFGQAVAGGQETAVSRHIYDRHSDTFMFRKLKLPLTTVTGVAEFDTLSYQTRLLLNLMSEQDAAKMRRVVVVNPGQGHTAVAAWKLWQPDELILIDRDLLALRTTVRNLLANGCPEAGIASFHQATWLLPPDVAAVDGVLGTLRDSEGPVVNAGLLETAVSHISDGALCLVAANSHLISQLSRRLSRQWREGKRKRRKGFSAVVFSLG